MGNETHTNTLHEKLSVELRRKVERDLVEQPPGRETYAKVYDFYGLAEDGVSIKALERYGGYLRLLARNRWIGELADAVGGKDLAPDIAGLIRTRLFEALVVGETQIGDLMKAAITMKSVDEAGIKREEWEIRRKVARQAVEREAGKAADGKLDATTVADLIDKVMRGEEVAA